MTSPTDHNPVNPVANKYDHPKVGNRTKHAAGLEGVAVSMRHAVPNHGILPLINMNKSGGVDCPGCAWPEPEQGDLGIVEFCENGAKAIAEETTPERADEEFWASYTVEELREKTDHWLGKQGRITTPLLYDRESGDGHYRPISWDDAYDLIAKHLQETPADEAVYYTSGRASNEAAYCFGLLARRHGTNNLPDCGNLCHESTGAALTQTVGLGKGSVTMKDIETTDLFISVGQNPGTNHPRALTAFHKLKRNGGKMIAVNPIPETGLMKFREPQSIKGTLGLSEKLADDYVQVRLDGDRAFFQQLNREVIKRDLIDHNFVEQFVHGYDEVVEHLKSLDPEELERGSGVPQKVVEKVADRVAKADSIVVGWTLGVTQHKNAVYTIREMVNFLLLTGNIGKPGAGTAPFRGHSNVQGDRTMGIWEKMSDTFLQSLQDEFGFDVPREHGMDSVDSFRAMRDGKARLFFSLGGNIVRVMSDTSAMENGFDRQDLTVHLSTKPNGSHAWPGKKALILPVKARTDVDMQASGPQIVSAENSAGIVSSSEGHRRANDDLNLQSETEIICRIGERAFGDDFWAPMRDNYDVVRDHIENTIPGFENYNERVRQPGGFYLPNGPRERIFNTDVKKAKLTVNETNVIDLPKDHLLLSTVRSHDQFNSTIYGLDDRYRGVRHGRRVIFVNGEDLRQRGLKDGDMVDIVSVWDDGERRAPNFRVVEYDSAKDCATSYFPECNVLVPLDNTADYSNTPAYKSVVIRLEPLGYTADELKEREGQPA
ncbi:hypothetical protein C3B44_01950 [Corynebacterium yudongzhengii]|uniref:FdhF/YdeP family oxidoreductase n=1 Tax=Corynebacterium yudongzhengii TaxID=2080740 RepID=A0A2U1TA00_9CORY|nr:FdhF/YdeP family oxidoreductase [Corynebacterium yudongzhengii]AWB82911.1 hypothetical protein C3B44_01950 [Corynebacterium yudongzhengii]PWC02840.1 hypothetical protein DF222_00680 [Corynebacterium yudongzhengii]